MLAAHRATARQDRARPQSRAKLSRLAVSDHVLKQVRNYLWFIDLLANYFYFCQQRGVPKRTGSRLDVFEQCHVRSAV